MSTKTIIFLGTAGAGKSSLCRAFGNWLKKEGYTIQLVNLDAAATHVPYSPDIDVREWFTASSIMKKEKIGPNAAILRASEKIIDVMPILLEKLTEKQVDFTIIDTPGQLEPFIFQESGFKFFRTIQEEFEIVGIYLIDASMFGMRSRACEMVVNLLLYMASRLKLGIDVLPILSKSDSLEDKNEVKKMLSDPDFLKALIEEDEDVGELKGVVLPILEHVIEPFARIVFTSKYQVDFSNLFDLIHENFCSCGDLS
ncbi:MAG: ATP/GTP-binding protein [Candidatus Helarchaeales archaeon]